MSDVTIDKLVAVDRKMTAKMEEIQAQLDEVEAQRKEVRKTILEIMNERNEESIRTASGTVTRSIKERYWTTDWPALHTYILEHGAVELLEKRVQQTNMRQWIEDHPNDYPPALNIDREYAITIRKPRKEPNE